MWTGYGLKAESSQGADAKQLFLPVVFVRVVHPRWRSDPLGLCRGSEKIERNQWHQWHQWHQPWRCCPLLVQYEYAGNPWTSRFGHAQCLGFFEAMKAESHGAVQGFKWVKVPSLKSKDSEFLFHVLYSSSAEHGDVFSIDQFPDMFPDSLELYSTSFNHIEASPLHCTDIAVEGHGEKYPQHPSWGS